MDLNKCDRCKTQLKYSTHIDYCKDCLRLIDPDLYWDKFGNSNKYIIVQDNRVSFDTLSNDDFQRWIKTFSKDCPPESLKSFPSFMRWTKPLIDES
jgi:hypothetical protein